MLTDGWRSAAPPTLRSVAASSLVLPPVTTSVRAARDFARERCHEADLGARACDVAVLLVSEVVTNAIVHGRSEARLRIVASGSTLRVEVGDDCPAHPQVQHVGPTAVHGRGVGFVDRLSTAWGVRDVPGGKVVWFTVDAAAAA